MKNVCLGMGLGMLIAACTLLVRDAVGGPAEKPTPAPQELIVSSIKVVDKEGRTCVAIVPEGVFVQDPCDTGRNVSLHFNKGYGPAVSLMDGATAPSRLALNVTDKEAYLQVVGKDGKVHIVPAKDLVKK